MDAHRGALNSACSIMPALARRYHCFQRRNLKNSSFSEEKSTSPEEKTPFSEKSGVVGDVSGDRHVRVLAVARVEHYLRRVALDVADAQVIAEPFDGAQGRRRRGCGGLARYLAALTQAA